MTFHLSRRALLAASAGSLAGPSATVAPVLASTERADVELIALGRRWQPLADACHAAMDRTWEAEERVVHPEPPEALFLRRGDLPLGLGTHELRGDRFWYGKRIADLRTKPRTRQSWSLPEDGSDDVLPRWVPDPLAQARADEIVAAWDQWHAERKAVEDAAGLTAAQAEENRCDEVERAVRLRILSTPARTIEGLIVKARVAAWCNSSPEAVQDNTREAIAAEDISDDALAWGLVSDLLQLAGAV